MIEINIYMPLNQHHFLLFSRLGRGGCRARSGCKLLTEHCNRKRHQRKQNIFY